MSEMDPTELAVAGAAAATSYVVADGLDRFLSTYDPSDAKKPDDKFTSDGAGTLANSLNVASPPGPLRLGVGVAATALPAVGAMFAEDPMARAAAEGAAIGAGVKLFSTIWNSFVMPLLAPSDTSTPTLQKSIICRLYPAETAAALNLKAHKEGPHPAAGVLSGQQDVGPFALAAPEPQYPTVDQALAYQTGVHGDSPYSTVDQALRAGVSGDSPYPNADQALRRAAGVGWEPAGPPQVGPGPSAAPHRDSASCGCVGDKYAMFLGDQLPDETHSSFSDVQRAVIREVDSAGFRAGNRNGKSNGLHR